MSILSKDPSRKPPDTQGKRIRFLERIMVEKNGQGDSTPGNLHIEDHRSKNFGRGGGGFGHFLDSPLEKRGKTGAFRRVSSSEIVSDAEDLTACAALNAALGAELLQRGLREVAPVASRYQKVGNADPGLINPSHYWGRVPSKSDESNH